MNKIDYLKQYNIFNFVLLIWIGFLPMKNSIYQVSVVLMIIMLIYHVTVFKNINMIKSIFKQQKSIFVAFGLIVLSMLLSSILGINTLSSLADTLKFFIRYILIFLVLLYFYKNDFFDKEFIMKIIIISLTVYALDGLYQYLTGYDFFKGKSLMGDGLTGPIFNRNIFGFIMGIGSIITFSLLFQEYYNSRYFKYIIFILFLLMIFNLFFSMSRASWLFFMIYFLLCVPYLYKNNLLNKKRLAMISVMIFLIIVLFVSNDSLLIRLNSLLNGNSSHRFELWMETLPYIRESFLFGYGIDTYTIVVTNKFSGIHNSFIEIFLFLGVFGFLSYLYFFRIVFLEIYKLKVYKYGFFLLSFLFLLQFDGSLIYSKLDLSVLVIILFFIYSNNFKESEKLC